MRRFLFVLVALTLAGCDKGEIPIDPHVNGPLETTTIDLGPGYKNQIFYNLESNSVVSQNEKTDWDLGFLTGPDDWQIVINSSKAGGVWRIDGLNFESVPDVSDAVWSYDRPSGNLDSTAIDDYRNTNVFYVVDLGYSSQLETLGYMKLKVDSVNEDGYFVRTADLEHNQELAVFIEKDEGLHRACFSFTSNAVVDIEPLSSDWDLLFTQYTNIFYDPFLPYLVAGVLINTQQTLVAVDTDKIFSDITYNDVDSYVFSSDQDAIGYAWKEFDFNTESYLVFPEVNYIIKNGDGQYFKLHFIDFYNDLGQTGYPMFEVQQL